MSALLRAAFLGNDAWSVPTLERLARAGDVDVVLVVTNPARPAGRGAKLTPTPVADVARRLELPLEETETTRDEAFSERLRGSTPDVSVVVAYGELLRSDVLNAPRLGSVNLHFSLLPQWRGASPVQHAILAGDPVTGVTVIRMDEGLDTGPVLARREQPIRSDDDAGSLGDRLAASGADLVVEVLAGLADGRVTPMAQTGPATFAPKLGPGDRTIDWRQPAGAIVRHVRAFGPDPGASTQLRAADLKVFRAEEASGPAGAPPGTVVDLDRAGVVVAAGSGSVRLLEVAAAGRRRMPAPDWARGIRDLVGERFGA